MKPARGETEPARTTTTDCANATPAAGGSQPAELLGALAQYRYIIAHLQRAIREHGDADISAQSVAERAAHNIARGSRGAAVGLVYLEREARRMLRRRWGPN